MGKIDPRNLEEILYRTRWLIVMFGWERKVPHSSLVRNDLVPKAA
jgi:hypothetical protein